MINDPNVKTLRLDRNKVLADTSDEPGSTDREKRASKQIMLTLGEWEQLKTIGDGNAALGISTCLAA